MAWQKELRLAGGWLGCCEMQSREMSCVGASFAGCGCVVLAGVGLEGLGLGAEAWAQAVDCEGSEVLLQVG